MLFSLSGQDGKLPDPLMPLATEPEDGSVEGEIVSGRLPEVWEVEADWRAAMRRSIQASCSGVKGGEGSPPPDP